MIYQLVNYIINNTSGLTITANGFQAESPDECITISDGGGLEQPWFNRKDITIQVLSRALNSAQAKKNLDTVYTLIKKKYGLSLPAVTVNGVIYPATTAWAIRPVSYPQYVAEDESGRSMYSFTVEVTIT